MREKKLKQDGSFLNFMHLKYVKAIRNIVEQNFASSGLRRVQTVV
jgi:hypothetical protein